MRMTCAATLLFMLLVSASADAGQAEICYSPAVPYADATPPDNDTHFSCPIAGDKTLPQLAADGWQVVQLTPISDSGSQITQQLVIQKP